MASSRRPVSGQPLPSTRLVSFGGFIGTMGQSDSRPRLDASLLASIATCPRWRPAQRTRSGLLGPDDGLSCVMWSSTPVERHRLAWRRWTRGLRQRERSRPPRHSLFRGSSPHPRQPLSTTLNPPTVQARDRLLSVFFLRDVRLAHGRGLRLRSRHGTLLSDSAGCVVGKMAPVMGARGGWGRAFVHSTLRPHRVRRMPYVDPRDSQGCEAGWERRILFGDIESCPWGPARARRRHRAYS